MKAIFVLVLVALFVAVAAASEHHRRAAVQSDSEIVGAVAGFCATNLETCKNLGKKLVSLFKKKKANKTESDFGFLAGLAAKKLAGMALKKLAKKKQAKSLADEAEAKPVKKEKKPKKEKKSKADKKEKKPKTEKKKSRKGCLKRMLKKAILKGDKKAVMKALRRLLRNKKSKADKKEKKPKAEKKQKKQKKEKKEKKPKAEKKEVELSDAQFKKFLCKLFPKRKGCKKPVEPTPEPAQPAPAPVEDEVAADAALSLSINQRGIDLIKSFEGWESCKYKDAVGLWTIGYGHLIKSGENFDRCLTQSEGEALLRKDVASFESCVNRAVTRSINSNQFSALVSFSFNLGCGNLQSSTLLKKVNAGAFSEACAEFRRWNKAGGRELAGLTRRREAECQLFNA